MRKGAPKILVSGGAGFIGSEFVRQLCRDRDCPRRGLSLKYKVIVLDKLTYAGDLKRLQSVQGKFRFYKTDICNCKAVEKIFQKENPRFLVHFAAESHVDRSIKDPSSFIETNIRGTQILLDLSRKYKVDKFTFVSTDEVYGEIKKGKFRENSPILPNSPYAVSKAAADLLVRAYIRTYDFPAIIVRPSNNYGPWQYPEKFIPRSILNLLRNKKISVYATGKNVREWLYVEDCAVGILAVLEKGRVGEVYNLGSGKEMKNIVVAKAVLKMLGANKNMIQFVKDRPGHDYRYRLDSGKIEKELKWRPRVRFEDGIKLTVKWYLRHKNWLLSKWDNVSRLYS